MMDVALAAATVQLKAEWDGVVCMVCGAAKWARYPFCRHCNIRLSRVHLLKWLKPLCGHAPWDRNLRRLTAEWAKRYDRARDYLVSSRKEDAEKKTRDVSNELES